MMPMNPVDREEYARHRRRRRRQLLGLVLSILVLIGFGTLIFGGYKGISALFDDTEEKLSYESRLHTLVMYDPLPFDTLENADPVLLREACIWGAIYNAKLTQGNLENYATDEQTGCLILPTVEVDAFASTLMGPFYTLTHEDFESDGLVYRYDPDLQGYLIPITSEAGRYTPKVTELHKEGRQMRVTVGYVPQFDPNDQFSFTTPDEPVKYRDYIFTRSDREFYLTGLEESEMKPSDSAAQNAPEGDLDLDFDPNQALMENLDEDLLQDVTGSSVPEEEVPESEPAEETPEEETPEENSEETSEEGEEESSESDEENTEENTEEDDSSSDSAA